MPTSRCPVVRPQAGSYGARGFVTDYHDWSDSSSLCRFCRQPRAATQTSRHDRYWGEDEAATAGQAPPHERYEAEPDPNRWSCIRALLP